jgi:hypothetical protein
MIGNTLTNGADREIVETYADQLETLGKSEVLQPKPAPLRGVHDELGVAIFANVFKKAFPLEAEPTFDALLIALVEKSDPGSRPVQMPIHEAGGSRFNRTP